MKELNLGVGCIKMVLKKIRKDVSKRGQLNKQGQLKIQVHKNPKGFLVLGFSRKAQLKIQEMAFMLVAVMFFFILVGLFVFSIVYSNLHEEATAIAEARTLSAITNLADSPEFQCESSKSNCVDGDKLITLVGRKSYENFWPFSSLAVVMSSAFDKSEDEMRECDFSNYPDCDRFTIYDKKVKNENVISSYVAICRKDYENMYTYEKCEIARLVAGSEKK